MRKILIGLSESCSTAGVLRRAVEVAKSLQASVTCLTLLDAERVAKIGPCGLGNSHAAKRLIARRLDEERQSLRQWAERFEAACAEHGIVCRSVAAEGAPVPVLSSYLSHHDLLISTCTDRSGGQDLVRLRELYDLAARSEAPVLVEPRNYRPIQKVLVAYDGSEAARHAVLRFAQVWPWPEATVRIVHFGVDAEAGHALLAEAQALFAAEGQAAEVAFVTGKISKLENYAAEFGADAMVLGNKGRAALLRPFVQDTTRDHLKHGERSLFMAR